MPYSVKTHTHIMVVTPAKAGVYCVNPAYPFSIDPLPYKPKKILLKKVCKLCV